MRQGRADGRSVDVDRELPVVGREVGLSDTRCTACILDRDMRPHTGGQCVDIGLELEVVAG